MTFDLNNLYEYKSAIQKCIRRGQELEAYYFASLLEEMDNKQLWTRLKIISVEDIGPANPMIQLIVESCEKNYFELINKNNSGGRLYLLQAITCMSRSMKSRDNDDLLCYVDSAIKENRMSIPVPDYALDKHTRRGKVMGRNWEHFFTVGTMLENKDPNSGMYAKFSEEYITKYGGPSDWKMARIKKNPQKFETSTESGTAKSTGLDSFNET